MGSIQCAKALGPHQKKIERSAWGILCALWCRAFAGGSVGGMAGRYLRYQRKLQRIKTSLPQEPAKHLPDNGAAQNSLSKSLPIPCEQPGAVTSLAADMEQSEGLWRSLFGWRHLFRWDVLGSLVPGVFIAVGIGMLSVDWFPHNLLISQTCFSIAALLFIAKTIGHAYTTRGNVLSKIMFCTAICGLVLAVAIFAANAIQSHKPVDAVAKPPKDHGGAPDGDESKSARRAEILATPFEDAWIGVSFQTTDAFMNQFNKMINDKYLEWFKKQGSINTVDNLAQQYLSAAWNSTFGSAWPCSPFGISSDMDFRISLHPPLTLHVSNQSINAICAVKADLFGHEQWLGLSNNGYILDSPAVVTALMPEPQNRGHFSLRFLLTARIMHSLSEGIPSTWRSFMIDTPAEINLAIGSRVCWWPGRFGTQIIDCPGSEPGALQRLKQDSAKAESMFPRKITLTTELIGGPMSIREYTFVPGLDPTIHGTGMYYRWKLTRYDEVKGFMYGGEPPPPSSTQPRGPR